MQNVLKVAVTFDLQIYKLNKAYACLPTTGHFYFLLRARKMWSCCQLLKYLTLLEAAGLRKQAPGQNRSLGSEEKSGQKSRCLKWWTYIWSSNSQIKMLFRIWECNPQVPFQSGFWLSWFHPLKTWSENICAKKSSTCWNLRHHVELPSMCTCFCTCTEREWIFRNI